MGFFGRALTKRVLGRGVPNRLSGAGVVVGDSTMVVVVEGVGVASQAIGIGW